MRYKNMKKTHHTTSGTPSMKWIAGGVWAFVFFVAALLCIVLRLAWSQGGGIEAEVRGHGIAGDDKYGKRDFNRAMRKRGYKGMFLHAKSIAFAYDARPVHVEAPLPDAAAHLITQLTQESP